MTFTHALSTNNYGPAKFVVSSSAANGTHTTIAAALTAASSGDTIFIRPGTYTENPTLKAGVDLVAFVTDADIPNVIILGTCSFSSAGTVGISGVQLQTNGSFALSVTGSAASVVYLTDCYINCVNSTGIQFTSSSSSANIYIYNTNGDLGTTGIALYTSSSPGRIEIRYGFFTNSGNSSTASSVSSGTAELWHSFFLFPFSTSSTGTMGILWSQVNSASTNTTCLTMTGTGNSQLEFSDFLSGSASAISLGSGTSATVNDPCMVNSSNTNAITGAGTINYSLIIYTGASSKNNVTTQSAYVTQPSIISANPTYFQAYLNAPQTVSASTPTTVIFNTTNSNVGSGYNTGTGVFTAPTTGFYQFNCILEGIMNTTGAQTDFVMALTGSVQSFRLAQVSSNAFDGNAIVQSGAWAMPMTAGDTVQVIADAAGTGTFQVYGATQSPSAFNNISQFSGYRVY
jgi:hypothetical protein